MECIYKNKLLLYIHLNKCRHCKFQIFFLFFSFVFVFNLLEKIMNSAVEIASNMVNVMNEIVVNVNNSNLDYYIKLCFKNIRVLKSAISVSNSVKLSLINAIANMVSYRTHLKIRKSATSGANRREEQSDRIRWEDLQNVFEGRIRTSCITNIKHINVESFLNDCKSMFKRRIHRLRQTFTFLKILVSFCGGFSKMSSSSTEHIKDFKYISTRTSMLDLDDDIDIWYDVNIKTSILRDLEEFQVSVFFFFLYL